MTANTCANTCRAVLRNSANESLRRSLSFWGAGDAPGLMLAADTWPDEMASLTFPPMAATCPHGKRFWTYPDANLIEALTQMNEGRYGRPIGGDA